MDKKNIPQQVSDTLKNWPEIKFYFEEPGTKITVRDVTTLDMKRVVIHTARPDTSPYIAHIKPCTKAYIRFMKPCGSSGYMEGPMIQGAVYSEPGLYRRVTNILKHKSDDQLSFTLTLE